MNQDELYIYNYIKKLISISLNDGNGISDYQIQRLFNSFYDKSMPLEQIIKNIDDNLSKLEQTDISDELLSLNFKSIGINLSMQQIDLLNIIGAKNVNELKSVCKTITNTTIRIDKFNINVNKMTSSEFEQLKKKCFKIYKNSLVELNYSHTDKGKKDILNNRIDYIMERGSFNPVERGKLLEVIKFSKNLDEIPVLLNKKFGKDKTSKILNLIKNYDPVESIGLINTTYEEFKNLYAHLHLFNSVCFNNEFCYTRICNADGTFYFDRVLKCLDFAKRHNMKVTINNLINYKFFPTFLYNSSSSLVYEKLLNYVMGIIEFAKDYNNKNNNIISKIIILEDLLEYEEPYRYRRLCESIKDKGWTGKITLNQILDICYKAKNSIKNVTFVYSEKGLERKNKRIALEKLLRSIKVNKKEVFDCIGAKLQLTSNITSGDLTSMIEDLKKLNYRLEITQFKMHVKEDFITTHTPEEIYSLKLVKYNTIKKIFNKYIDDLDSFTIHSISNKMDYYKFDKNNLDNFYGGYFGDDITLISRLKIKSNINYANYLMDIDESKYTIKDYIDRAIANQIKTLGFTKRITNNKYVDEENYLKYEELNNFIKDIKLTKLNYADMKLYSGIIADYDILNIDYLMECKSKCDYIVLDASVSKLSINTPLEYAKKVCDAMESGIFDMVLYPDKFMKYRDKFDYNTYIDNCLKASDAICSCAKRLEIPLCIDLNYNLRRGQYIDKEWAINHSLFWNIAIEKNNIVIISNSITDPSSLDNMSDNVDKLRTNIDINSLNLASSKYDLILTRRNNRLLNKKMFETNSKYHCYEYYFIKDIIEYSNDILKDLNKAKTKLNGKKEEEIIDWSISCFSTKSKDNYNNILKLVEKKYSNREKSKAHKAGYTYTLWVIGIIFLTAIITCLILILLK